MATPNIRGTLAGAAPSSSIEALADEVGRLRTRVAELERQAGQAAVRAADGRLLPMSYDQPNNALRIRLANGTFRKINTTS